MFVLASASPRRKELMKKIIADFIIDPSDCDENISGQPLEKVSENLALRKAEDVFPRHPEDVVIGSDTTVICDGKLFGKPVDREDAKRMLETLSGREQYIISGVAIISKKGKEVFSEKTTVYFRELTDEDIERYLDTDEPYDKAGAYAIQGKAADFVTRIEGDLDNVIGFPVSRIKEVLNTMNIDFEG